MCNECKRVKCPDPCPGGVWVSEGVEHCRLCGDAVLDGEECFCGQGVWLCESCADRVDIDDLIQLCDYENTAELLEILGFRHII